MLCDRLGLSPSHILPHLICTATAGSVVIPILQMRRREVKQLAQGHTAGKQQRRDAKCQAQGLRGRACLLVDGSLQASLRIHRTQVLCRRKSTLSRARQEVGGRHVAILEKRHEKPRNFLPVPFCSHLSSDTRLPLS